MRLIDADDLKKAVINNFDNLQAYFPKDFIEEIDNAPTVEAKTIAECIIAYGDGYESARRLYERPQGEWIPHNNSKYDFECSLCNFPAPSRIDGWSYKTKFCPWCGAIMLNSEV